MDSRFGSKPANYRGLNNSELNDEYAQAMADYVDQKNVQAERVESKLHDMIEYRAEQLTQLESNRPGFFASSDAKARWQNNVNKVQQQLAQARTRLDRVKEISSDESTHGQNVEKMALNKLKKDEPDLVKSFNKMLEEQRRHHLHLAYERKKKQEKQQAQGKGLSQSLTHKIHF